MSDAPPEVSPQESRRRQEAFMQKRLAERKKSRLNLGVQDGAVGHAARGFVRISPMLLPVAAVFAVASSAYVLYDGTQRAKRPVCTSCNRQKEIAEEVYGVKDTAPKRARVLP
jgi:hypothetical protein